MKPVDTASVYTKEKAMPIRPMPPLPVEGFLLVHYDGSSSPNATLYPTEEARLHATREAVFFEYDEEEHGDEFRTIVEQLTEEGTWGTEGDGALAWMNVDAAPFLNERYVAVPEFP